MILDGNQNDLFWHRFLFMLDVFIYLTNKAHVIRSQFAQSFTSRDLPFLHTTGLFSQAPAASAFSNVSFSVGSEKNPYSFFVFQVKRMYFCGGQQNHDVNIAGKFML